MFYFSLKRWSMKDEIVPVPVVEAGGDPAEQNVADNETTFGDDVSNNDAVEVQETARANLPSSPNNDNSTTPEEEVGCPLCYSTPCLLRQGLYDSITEYEDEIRQSDADETLTNKQMRFKLYRHATTWMHGFLGKRRRIEIPQCVRTEILDLAPESNGAYVGFKDVAEST